MKIQYTTTEVDYDGWVFTDESLEAFDRALVNGATWATLLEANTDKTLSVNLANVLHVEF